MRLFTSPGSPFARKCRIVAREKGAAVEEVTAAFPYKDDAYTAINPLGQVPALVADDGAVFFDSPIICAYLDEIGSGPKLLPSSGPAHWRVRRLEALGDGIMEMTVKQVLEGRRPEGERSADWLGHWRGGLLRALDLAETLAPTPEDFDLGAVALAVAATYIDFRMPTLDWRAGRGKLAALTAALEERPSFKETFPR